MVLPMPIEVEDLPIEVGGTIELQADLVCLLLPVREGESGLSSSRINIWAKLHFAAVFNDGIGAGGQVEVDSLRVVDSDLVRLQMYEAVSGFINKTCSADTANINACLFDVLDVEALNTEGQDNNAIGQVLNDHVLFPLIIHRCLHNLRLVSQVTNQQVIAIGNHRICAGLCSDGSICCSLGNWLGLRCCTSLLANESKLFRGLCRLFFFSKEVHILTHRCLIATEHARWNGILIVGQHLSECHCLGV